MHAAPAPTSRRAVEWERFLGGGKGRSGTDVLFGFAEDRSGWEVGICLLYSRLEERPGWLLRIMLVA